MTMFLTPKIVVIASICLVVSMVSATEYVTIGDARNKLADSDFSFSFKKDSLSRNRSGIRTEQLIPYRNRILSMPDVNVQFARVFQEHKNVIPWHVHPRGCENYATIEGYLQVTISLEGMHRPRRVVSKLPPGHVAVIPQGIPHTVTCLSKKTCVYHIFFNNADSGFALLAPAKRTDKINHLLY